MALDAKASALETLLARRLPVLRGGAGTGKTTVLRALLSELERREGKAPVLLLAPTGKARLRLATQTQCGAMTIHQLLLRQGWLAPETFTLRASSELAPYNVPTVIIDEYSMIPADVFGTLLCALDLNTARRLILVGDPNCLPPIGPGRPCIDIIG
jgi:ATP-dependent exoDNAse (exonuclease V) alpha subunit